MFTIDFVSIWYHIEHILAISYRMNYFIFKNQTVSNQYFPISFNIPFRCTWKQKMLVCKWLILYNVCTVIFVPKAHNHKFNPISIHYWLQSINKINLLLDAKHDEKELAFEGENEERIYSCCIIIENTLRIRYIGFLKLLQAGIWFYLLRRWGSKTK